MCDITLYTEYLYEFCTHVITLFFLMNATFSTDPFSVDKKPTRKPRQPFTPESFTRYRFTPTGTPVLLAPPRRGPSASFTEHQASFNLRRDDGTMTTVTRSSILTALGNDTPATVHDLPPGTVRLRGFSDYALCPANGSLFRYKSPVRGIWPAGSRLRIKGRRHGGSWARRPEYFRLLSDESGTYKHLSFDKILAAAGLTTRQFAQKFKGSQFFVDGVPLT